MPKSAAPAKIAKASGNATAKIAIKRILITTAIIEVIARVFRPNLNFAFPYISGYFLGNLNAARSTRVTIKSNPKFSIAANVSKGGLIANVTTDRPKARVKPQCGVPNLWVTLLKNLGKNLSSAEASIYLPAAVRVRFMVVVDAKMPPPITKKPNRGPARNASAGVPRVPPANVL